MGMKLYEWNNTIWEHRFKSIKKINRFLWQYQVWDESDGFGSSLS